MLEVGAWWGCGREEPLLVAERNTVKRHLRQLKQQGYLEQYGTGKGDLVFGGEID